MREYSHVISQALVSGLKPDPRVSRMASVLTDAVNVKATQFGLKQIEPVVDPFMETVQINFPFPQLFIGEEEIILADEDRLFKVDVHRQPWRRERVDTFGTDRNSTRIKEGGVWHFLDMKSSWFLFNGTSTIWKDNTDFLRDNRPAAYVDNSGKITTGTAHRGRAVVGGFDPREVWADGWEAIYESWKMDMEEDVPMEYDDVGKNFVVWSSIGGGDFPLWLFRSDLAMEGVLMPEQMGVERDPDIASEYVLDKIKRNEMGFMPMPWPGEVLAIKPLGKALVVYGTEGVTALYLANHTYGMKHLRSTGVYDRGSVGVAYGNNETDARHVWVDSEGSLWTVNAGLEVEKLGYTDYLIDMFGEQVSISHGEEDDEFLICSKSHGFILTREGLTRQEQKVTSQTFAQGGSLGIVENRYDRDVEVVTNTLDFNERGIKRITSVALGVLSPKEVRVAVEYRYDTDSAFKRSKPIPANREGNARLDVSGVDFRVVIMAPDFEDFELDYITVNYQLSDNRFRRGVNVSTDAS